RCGGVRDAVGQCVRVDDGGDTGYSGDGGPHALDGGWKRVVSGVDARDHHREGRPGRRVLREDPAALGARGPGDGRLAGGQPVEEVATAGPEERDACAEERHERPDDEGAARMADEAAAEGCEHGAT